MTTLLERLVPLETKYWLNTQTLIAFTTFALFVHAVLVDVVIHPFFFTPYCLIPLLLPGGALSSFAIFQIAAKTHRTPVGVCGLMGLLVLPFFGAAIFWIVFAKTPAWVAAAAFGEPHSEVHEFNIRTRGDKGCSYRAEVVDGLRLMPGYLCVSWGYASQYDHQRVRLRLSGDKTPLGFRITHIEHEDVLGRVPPG